MDTGLALNTDAQLAAAVVTAYALAQQGVEDPQQLSDALFNEIGTLTAEQRSFDEPPKGGKVGMTRPLNKIRPKLESFDDDKARKWTRFTYRDLIALSQAIGIPDPYITSCRDRFSAVEALAILCNRLVFPSRLEDLADRWGRDYAQISRVTNELAHFIDNEWAFLLADMSRFTPNDLERFVSATIHAGCPANDIALFLDATFEEVTEPTDDQRAMYSGYLKGHAYKWQGVAAPDGLIVLCHGPIEGRRADGKLLEVSGLPDDLVAHCKGYGGRQLFVYADPAYIGEAEVVLTGLKKLANLTQAERDFNSLMAKLRQSVEWAFGKLSTFEWEFF